MFLLVHNTFILLKLLYIISEHLLYSSLSLFYTFEFFWFLTLFFYFSVIFLQTALLIMKFVILVLLSKGLSLMVYSPKYKAMHVANPRTTGQRESFKYVFFSLMKILYFKHIEDIAKDSNKMSES